jgi:hypothetical protein
MAHITLRNCNGYLLTDSVVEASARKRGTEIQITLQQLRSICEDAKEVGDQA